MQDLSRKPLLANQVTMRTADKFLSSLSIALLTGAVGLTGCSPREPDSASAHDSPAPAKPSYRFVVVSHATAVPFFVPVRKGVEEAAKLLGVEASFTGPADVNVARQIEAIKAAIA